MNQPVQQNDEAAVRALYHQMLDWWNLRRADGIASLYEEDASVIGFDGSMMNSAAEIYQEMQRIFTDHQTAVYVGKVREVRFLSPDVALLRAASGMISPGQNDLNPAVNTIQSMVAVKRGGRWRIALYQNTPAQFHGRPDLAERLTEELRGLLKR